MGWQSFGEGGAHGKSVAPGEAYSGGLRDRQERWAVCTTCRDKTHVNAWFALHMNFSDVGLAHGADDDGGDDDDDGDSDDADDDGDDVDYGDDKWPW